MPHTAQKASNFDAASLYGLLDSFVVPDDIRARAYEGLAPVDRARLKQTVARIFALYPACPRQESRTLELDGFHATAHWQAASSLVCLCSCGYTSPQALLAALVPAALARVEHIIVCFVDDGPVPATASSRNSFASLLAALDIGGFEMACLVPAKVVHHIINDEKMKPGRLLLLGAVHEWEKILVDAAKNGITTLPLPVLPTSVSGGQSASLPDNADGFIAGLSLDAGHEGVWLWPGLVPEWFRDNSLVLSNSC